MLYCVRPTMLAKPDHLYLSPNGKSVISPADREWVGLGGLAVVEASWARLDEVPFNKIRSPHERLRKRLRYRTLSCACADGILIFSTILDRYQSCQLW
jgi:hypothetical protein